MRGWPSETLRPSCSATVSIIVRLRCGSWSDIVLLSLPVWSCLQLPPAGKLSEQLEPDHCSGMTGNVAVVVWWSDLHDVEAVVVERAHGPQVLQGLVRGRAAHLRRTGARGVGGVEEVDVERHQHRVIAHAGRDAA